jgi:L-ascorbate metabolism protein UlaG (beta-lactamase superfamily)
MTVQIRWLGVAGIEIGVGNETLLVDPYLTRIPPHKLFIGRARPNDRLIDEHVGPCDTILVTHSHFDHLLDVPHIALRTGATVWGSRNTCRILAAHGVPAAQIRCVHLGEAITLDGCEVEVLPVRHPRTPLDRWLNGAVAPDLQPPLRALDYRMDACVAFYLRAGDESLLIAPGRDMDVAPPADVLFISPFAMSAAARATYWSLLERVRPRVVIPYHWDVFWRPLDRPLRPMLLPTGRLWPPLQRVDLDRLGNTSTMRMPDARVVVPRLFEPYALEALCSGA